MTCADAATVLSANYEPFEALARWMQSYAAFIATERGLARVLHSGDPAFGTLPGYFDQWLRPALRKLLETAAATGEVHVDVDADELLVAVASLCMSNYNGLSGRSERVVALLVDGLRYRTSARSRPVG